MVFGKNQYFYISRIVVRTCVSEDVTDVRTRQDLDPTSALPNSEGHF